MYHKRKGVLAMWFWWFVLVSDLLVPVIQIIFGWLMWKHGPKSVNNIYGYRTARSKKNPDLPTSIAAVSGGRQVLCCWC